MGFLGSISGGVGTVQNNNGNKQLDSANRTRVENNESKEKNMSDIRRVKFETLIEDMDSRIKKRATDKAMSGATSAVTFGFKFASAVSSSIETVRSKGNTALALVFDYDKCNDYAKIIMDKSTLFLHTSDDRFTNLWKKEYPTYDEFQDAKTMIAASKRFVQLCGKLENSMEGYKFIFWALMILTVDKTDAEDHLALICDFAKMLKITEEEFEDIIQVIKFVYNEVQKYEFKSQTICKLFAPICDLWEIV